MVLGNRPYSVRSTESNPPANTKTAQGGGQDLRDSLCAINALSKQVEEHGNLGKSQEIKASDCNSTGENNEWA